MAISDDIGTLNDLIDDPKVLAGGKATFKGKQYSLADLICLRNDLEEQQQAEESAATKAKATALAEQRTARETQRETNRKVAQARGQLEAAEGNLDLAISRGDDIATPQANLVAAIGVLRKLNPSDEMLSKYPVETAPRVIAPRRATAGMRGEGGTVTTPEPPPPPPPPPPAGKNKGKGGKAEGGTVAKQGQVDDTTWMNTFKEQYPAYSDWTTTEVVDYFGQDFVDILMEVAKGDIEYTDEELRTRLKNTNYFRGVTDKQYAFDASRPAQQKEALDAARRTLVSEYGDLNLTEADLSELSRQVARSGLSGSGLKQAVYQFAFRRPSAAPGLTSPKTAVAALQGADADALRASLKAYGYRASDAEIQAALTGGMLNGVAVSGDQLLQKAQLAAKGQFSHLAEQIDGGLSLDDIFRNYQSYAADVLELDPNQIDFTRDPKWAEAFGTKETGQLSLGEWTNRLKTDPKFGWQYTNAANKQAEDVALSLARAFGKVQ